ncbi:MAG: hypothetical protein HC793_03400 [Aquincola sp.]|nr:hypothetical protein [Aquincola sp.]
MDPHGIALLYHSRIVFNLYDSLVNRDPEFRIEPGLATAWQLVNPTVWRFKLRAGVKFHDGSAFTADDVVFSIQRALSPPSQRSFQLKGVTGARKVDELTVEMLTDAPDAVLPEKLVFLPMMSKAWSERHGVQKAQDFNAKQETFAVRNAMGTGPFQLERYEPDVRTVLKRHTGWWGHAMKDDKRNGNVDEITFVTIKSDATRLAALASGEVDLVLDPPYQDIRRLQNNPGITLTQTADIGQQYLGFDQSRPELEGSDVKGRNPFKDLRVRQAVYHAINVPLIVDKVLRGQAQPTGAFLSPMVDGSPAELDKRLPYDPARATQAAGRGRLPQRLFRTAGLRERGLARERLPGRGGHAHAGGHTHAAAQQPQHAVLPAPDQRQHAFLRGGLDTAARCLEFAERPDAQLQPRRPGHLQRRPLQQPEARRADRRPARGTRPHAPPRDGHHHAAAGGRRPAVDSAVPPHAHLGHGQESERGALAQRPGGTALGARGCPALTR